MTLLVISLHISSSLLKFYGKCIHIKRYHLYCTEDYTTTKRLLRIIKVNFSLLRSWIVELRTYSAEKRLWKRRSVCERKGSYERELASELKEKKIFASRVSENP